MAKGKAFSQNDFDDFLLAYRAGNTVKEAAEVVKWHEQTIYRALRDMPEWRQQMDESREIHQRLRANRFGDKAISVAVATMNNPDHKDQWKATEKFLDAYVPEFKQPQRVELTGAEGSPLVQLVEGERRAVSINDVIQLASDLGIRLAIGVDGASDRGALPAAENVLPDPAADK